MVAWAIVSMASQVWRRVYPRHLSFRALMHSACSGQDESAHRHTDALSLGKSQEDEYLETMDSNNTRAKTVTLETLEVLSLWCYGSGCKAMRLVSHWDFLREHKEIRRSTSIQ